MWKEYKDHNGKLFYNNGVISKWECPRFMRPVATKRSFKGEDGKMWKEYKDHNGELFYNNGGKTSTWHRPRPFMQLSVVIPSTVVRRTESVKPTTCLKCKKTPCNGCIDSDDEKQTEATKPMYVYTKAEAPAAARGRTPTAKRMPHLIRQDVEFSCMGCDNPPYNIRRFWKGTQSRWTCNIFGGHKSTKFRVNKQDIKECKCGDPGDFLMIVEEGTILPSGKCPKCKKKVKSHEKIHDGTSPYPMHRRRRERLLEEIRRLQ